MDLCSVVSIPMTLLNLLTSFTLMLDSKLAQKPLLNGVKPDNALISQMSGVRLKDGVLESTLKSLQLSQTCWHVSSANQRWMCDLFD